MTHTGHPDHSHGPGQGRRLLRGRGHDPGGRHIDSHPRLHLHAHSSDGHQRHTVQGQGDRGPARQDHRDQLQDSHNDRGGVRGHPGDVLHGHKHHPDHSGDAGWCRQRGGDGQDRRRHIDKHPHLHLRGGPGRHLAHTDHGQGNSHPRRQDHRDQLHNSHIGDRGRDGRHDRCPHGHPDHSHGPGQGCGVLRGRRHDPGGRHIDKHPHLHLRGGPDHHLPHTGLGRRPQPPRQ